MSDAHYRKRHFLRDAWRLAWPYFVSEEKWIACGLLAGVIALSLASVAFNVRFNIWNKDFYNALQKLDSDEFFRQLGIFAGLAAVYIAVAVYQIYLTQMLQIRWRRWLTLRYLKVWLTDRTYYRMQLIGEAADNPDQRISEDLERFTKQSLVLSVGLSGIMSSVVTFISFLAILWNLSGTLNVPLGSWGIVAVPGYLVWVAIVYAACGTWLVFKIGRPLVGLNFNQQRYEADFRFSLVRLRENTESVAFYGGESREQDHFTRHFARVFVNFRQVMRRQRTINWFGYGYGQVAVVFPYLVAAPRFFTQQIQLGELMQIASAFGQVQTSLSFIVNTYADIAEYQSVVQRLATFEEKARELSEHTRGPQPIVVEREGEGLSVNNLSLTLPDGAPLREGVVLDVVPKSAVLLSGPSGSGKSTILRAIAGLWPYGEGRVRLAQGAVLFLPQKPYLPLGTLRNAILYPREHNDVEDDEILEALEKVGLSKLSDKLEDVEHWAQRLSLGEQQRVAFARILLTRPAVVFLDEATSALDEPSEAKLYKLLREAPWKPTIISVGHRSTLKEFHDKTLDIVVPATEVTEPVR